MKFVSAIYFCMWSIYHSHQLSDLKTDKLTHVFIAFMNIDHATGNMVPSDDWAFSSYQFPDGKGISSQLVNLKLQNPHLRVILSVGGWGAHTDFIVMTSDPDKRGNFVQSCVTYLARYSLDGIDIDWEYPTNAAEAENLVILLRELKSALVAANPAYILSAALPASSHYAQHLKIQEMVPYLDLWNIMTYDLAGPTWSEKVGYQSNLYGNNGDNELSVNSTMNWYFENKVPKERIVLGMPMYGQLFTGVTQPTIGAGFTKVLQAESVQYRNIDRLQEQYNETAVAAMVYDASANTIITYDNPQCAMMKAKYVRDHGLAGGFWWESQGDVVHGESLLDAFVSELEKEPVSQDGVHACKHAQDSSK